MADNDIYNSEGKFNKFKENLSILLEKPNGGKRKYYCKNKNNLKYFHSLFNKWSSKDTSYVRRLRLCKSLCFIVHNTYKDLVEVKREDIDQIVTNMHIVCKSPKSKSDFIKDMKYMWKIFLPDKDTEGRFDETIIPYVVRHVDAKMDKSKERMRGDKISFNEYEKLLHYFSNDIRIQCYLSLAVESLSRPQEILYRRIKDIELYDDYAKILISDHGKEGPGFMQCIDSYPYLIKLLESHPYKYNKESFLFLTTGNRGKSQQLTPINVNQRLRTACSELGITQNLTCYSLKRNGVTFRRLRGDSDMDIQHAARWTSARQLKTYDLSSQDDAFKIQLIKKGLVNADKPELKQYQPTTKLCLCGTSNAFTSEFCSECKRPLDRKQIAQIETKKIEEMSLLKSEIDALKQSLEARKPYEDMMAKLFKMPEAQELFKRMIKYA